MFADAILILCISFFTAFLSEGKSTNVLIIPSYLHLPLPSPLPTLIGILFVLVYRTDDYKRLKSIVEKQSKKCNILIVPYILEIFASFVEGDGSSPFMGRSNLLNSGHYWGMKL